MGAAMRLNKADLVSAVLESLDQLGAFDTQVNLRVPREVFDSFEGEEQEGKKSLSGAAGSNQIVLHLDD